MKVVIDIPENYYYSLAAKEVLLDKPLDYIQKIILDGTPLTKGEWVPVSDPLNELPKDKHLLVTVEAEVWHGEKSRYVTELYYDMTEWSDINDAKNAIAYIPYPEPYEADKEAQNES